MTNSHEKKKDHKRKNSKSRTRTDDFKQAMSEQQPKRLNTTKSVKKMRRSTTASIIKSPKSVRTSVTHKKKTMRNKS